MWTLQGNSDSIIFLEGIDVHICMKVWSLLFADPLFCVFNAYPGMGNVEYVNFLTLYLNF